VPQTPQPNAPLRLTIATVSTSARVARPGRPFGVAAYVIRSDTGGVLTEGTISCIGLIAGRRVSVAFSGWSHGAAACLWRIPLSAAGKQFRGAISVTYNGVTATKRVSARVARRR
jgi:hypothetical protein